MPLYEISWQLSKILAAKILVQQNKKDAAKKQLAAAVNVKGAPATLPS